jgi:transketolase C-terminal domain/subunit
MRTAFVEELTSLAHEDPAVVLLTGDLGYTVFEPFQAEFPDRYINCGVAEANMMGTAAGLPAKASSRSSTRSSRSRSFAVWSRSGSTSATTNCP